MSSEGLLACMTQHQGGLLGNGSVSEIHRVSWLVQSFDHLQNTRRLATREPSPTGVFP